MDEPTHGQGPCLDAAHHQPAAAVRLERYLHALGVESEEALRLRDEALWQAGAADPRKPFAAVEVLDRLLAARQGAVLSVPPTLRTQMLPARPARRPLGFFIRIALRPLATLMRRPLPGR